MGYGLEVVTPPAAEPLSADEALEYLGRPALSTAAADRFIREARVLCERVTGRALLAQTLRLTLDGFPDGGFAHPFFGEDDAVLLPRPPALEVTSIVYVATGGTSTTLATTDWTADVRSSPARVYPAYGESWPATRCQPNAVTITYRAGYGTAATDVPEDLRGRLLEAVAHLYDRRGSRDAAWLEALFAGWFCGVL